MINPAADLLRWIPEQSTHPDRDREFIYRLLKRGIDTDTITRSVQTWGVSEAYFLLTTGLASPKHSWWRRMVVYVVNLVS